MTAEQPTDLSVISPETLRERIFVIRGVQVMLDSDLAQLYKVETKSLNQTVKRNLDRFPEEFMFQLDQYEAQVLRCQFGTSNSPEYPIILRSQFVTSKKSRIDKPFPSSATTDPRGGRRYLPYVFTEQGVAMLAGVLRSPVAIQMSIGIMKAFVQMRHYIHEYSQYDSRLSKLETKIFEHDRNFEQVFRALESPEKPITQGIFFQGQIFDAYSFFQDIIKNAQHEILLVDNYVDLSVLERLTSKRKNVAVTIYTNPKTSLTSLDVSKFNQQYPTLTLQFTENVHDRFLVIDDHDIYHLGASLRDLGKKCFAFTKMDDAQYHIAGLRQQLAV